MVEENTFASVVVDYAIDKPLDYLLPAALKSDAKVGMRVLVPIRGKPCKGTIFSLKQAAETASVQPILELLEEPPLPEELVKLAEWMANYYACPLRKVLKVFLPPSIRESKEKQQQLIRSLISHGQLLEMCKTLRSSSPPQARVLEVLLTAPKGLLLTELLEKAEVSRSPVESLIKKKILINQQQTIDRSPLSQEDYFLTKAKTLNSQQQSALEKIIASTLQNDFQTHLLHGVTGSGKTEIYLQAMECALAQNKGVIFLVPEIALTSQTVERLYSRFEKKITLLHHRLSDGERRDGWHHILTGKTPIAIGARSTLFCPMPNLGLIIVDEEHDSSYKQSDEAPHYHARDVAIVRAKFSSATVVLGSATPSFESFYNASKGKYLLSSLTTRADQAQLPTIQIVDMKRERTKGMTLFSEPLIDALKGRVTRGEQSLLFLNRRGYRTSQLCQKCSFVLECPHCDIALTFHLGENTLACHLCDYRLVPPKQCPNCKCEEGLKYRGAGTELVERSLHALIPEARTLRLDADTTRHKGSHELLYKQFRSGKADILIGTQMIAKGLHFPSVTLVGVLNTDTLLQIPDFRASEQLFQLITQVSGRAGRGAIKGEVILQTSLPENEVIQCAATQDFDRFYAQEISIRELFGYPPFSHLVKLTFSSSAGEHAEQSAKKWRQQLIQRLPASFQIHPVIPCGHAKIKDRYRFQFLIKGARTSPISQAFFELSKTLTKDKDLRVSIDVDPTSSYF